jgi:hypothetical protein
MVRDTMHFISQSKVKVHEDKCPHPRRDGAREGPIQKPKNLLVINDRNALGRSWVNTTNAMPYSRNIERSR